MSPDGRSHLPDKPFHSKRPHRKTRAGCVNCKKRIIKCNEGKPSCSACLNRREHCEYQQAMLLRVPQQHPYQQETLLRRRQQSPPRPHPLSLPPSHLEEFRRELFPLPETTSTPKQLQQQSLATGPLSPVLSLLQRLHQPFKNQKFIETQKLKQLANMSEFESAVSGHLQSYQPPVDCFNSKQVDAIFAKLKDALSDVEVADPDMFPHLVVAFLLMTAISSEQFRDEHSEFDLFIVNWIKIWGGIGIMMDRITTPRLVECGLSKLFYRPPLDLKAADEHIPQVLRQPVDDFPDAQYHDVYDVTPTTRVWWMEEVGQRSIKDVVACLGPSKSLLIQVPIAALETEDFDHIGRLLLADGSWEHESSTRAFSPEEMLSFDARDTHVDDSGGAIVNREF
ncbi:Sterol uptake control protein 2 [Beauveria bassiana D1-5]|uniref:Sterol uptake control protein 2 n=1 Tax=Beauveria bassiana D1-5 TaxID=1245745 RepID=A0A0A2V5I1_BEABA|nr:Sterol uptake control protein 2 [Beauveria bassiana D1-5]